MGMTELLSYDERVLESVRTACKVLGISKTPSVVEWRDITPPGYWSDAVHSDRVALIWKPQVGRVLVLPSRMKGKLEPEEWMPLVFSLLIMKTRLQGIVARHFLFRWTLLGLLIISFTLATLYGLGESLGINPQQFPPVPTVVLLLTVLFLASYFFQPHI